jgi:transcriptional regulator with XRE-family HTH domain
VVYQRVGHISGSVNFSEFPTLQLQNAFFLHSNISVVLKESKIILAIKAIRTSKKLSRRKAAKIYEVSFSILNDRMNSKTSLSESRPVNTNLTILEEEVIIRNILDIDSRGFIPRLASIEDIVNYILKSRERKRVSKL